MSGPIAVAENSLPWCAQRPEGGHSRLKRVVLIGDHHQLPPVVKNMAFQKYSHLDQSLFTRFVRLGTPYLELNAQVCPPVHLQSPPPLRFPPAAPQRQVPPSGSAGLSTGTCPGNVAQGYACMVAGASEAVAGAAVQLALQAVGQPSQRHLTTGAVVIPPPPPPPTHHHHHLRPHC